MRAARIPLTVAILALGLAGCSQQTEVLGPDANPSQIKDGTETLGVPSIAIAAGRNRFSAWRGIGSNGCALIGRSLRPVRTLGPGAIRIASGAPAMGA